MVHYLKMRIDENRHSCGRFVLTGSQTFQLMQGVSESLAGRIAIFDLYPLTWDEMHSLPGCEDHMLSPIETAKQMVQGFYPELVAKPTMKARNWHSSYISTFIERDVRNIKAISDLGRFQAFLSLLAARVGSILNLSEVAKQCGISQPTAKNWLSILQATYIIFLLKPYFKNQTKRLVKSPKLFFFDTGLACHLLGIDSAERLMHARERGNLFENMVIMDKAKGFAYRGEKGHLYFYRTHGGEEVDLLLERGNDLIAFEIKFSQTPNQRMASGLVHFQKEYPHAKAALLTLRTSSLPLTRTIQAVHWSQKIDEEGANPQEKDPRDGS